MITIEQKTRKYVKYINENSKSHLIKSLNFDGYKPPLF